MKMMMQALTLMHSRATTAGLYSVSSPLHLQRPPRSTGQNFSKDNLIMQYLIVCLTEGILKNYENSKCTVQ